MAQQFQVTSAVLSDKGRKRDNNEDYALMFEPGDEKTISKSGNLYVVADGVGGEARGEFASRFAAEKVLYEYYTRTQEIPVERLRLGMEMANREIQDFTRDTQSAKMATTLVAVAVLGDNMTVANIGDSRAYLYREGQLEQITRDHNLVGEMVASGLMTEEEGEKSDVKNRLLRSVGGHPDFKPDFFINLPLRPGDRILLCSDGLTRYARKETVEEHLKQKDVNEVVKNLVSFANQSGGADNITALLIEVRPAPAGYQQVQRGSLPNAVVLKNLVQSDMAGTISLQEPADTKEMLIGTADRTLEIAQPLPDIEKTQQTVSNQGTQPQAAQPAAPTGLPAGATGPRPAVKPGFPPFPPGVKKSGSSSRLWIIVILLAVIVVTILAAVGFLVVRNKWFGMKATGTPTTEQTAGEVQEGTPSLQIPTATEEAASPTVAASPTDTLQPTQNTGAAQAETPAATSEPQETEPVAGDVVNQCISKPQDGEGLILVLDRFGVKHDPNETYTYYNDCQTIDEKISCGDTIDLPPGSHEKIDINSWIVIPETGQQKCEANGGTWYSFSVQ